MWRVKGRRETFIEVKSVSADGMGNFSKYNDTWKTKSQNPKLEFFLHDLIHFNYNSIIDVPTLTLLRTTALVKVSSSSRSRSRSRDWLSIFVIVGWSELSLWMMLSVLLCDSDTFVLLWFSDLSTSNSHSLPRQLSSLGVYLNPDLNHHPEDSRF